MNQPKFCMYCTKNISAYLKLAQGLIFCPKCGGDLTGLEDKFLDIVTVPETGQPKKPRRKLAPKKSKIRQRILLLIQREVGEGLTRTKLNSGMGHPKMVWGPVLDEMVDKGSVIVKKCGKGGKCYFLSEMIGKKN